MPTEQLLAEMNGLRKSRDQLQKELDKRNAFAAPDLHDLAGLDDEITIHATEVRVYEANAHHERKITWRELFGLLAPHLLARPNDQVAHDSLSRALFQGGSVDDQDYQTVKIDLSALELVTVDYLRTTQGSYGLFWSLTAKGQALMMETRAVRKPKAP
jgi:hypothetical protein